jgi:hypothetical protein
MHLPSTVKTDCQVPKGSDGVAYTAKARQADLNACHNCLQPNRRVEVMVSGVKR